MDTEFLILTLIALMSVNVANAEIDAVRILGQKPIAHALNLSLYLLVTAVLGWYVLEARTFSLWAVFTVDAFAIRQIFFDIPLNWRRDLSWDYVSPATPPKAFMDRLEQKIWGKNGKAPVYWYLGTFLTTTLWLLFFA